MNALKLPLESAYCGSSTLTVPLEDPTHLPESHKIGANPQGKASQELGVAAAQCPGAV